MVVSATAESPCKDCKERHLHCHAECGKYKEYKDTLENNRYNIHKMTEEGNFLRDLKRNVVKKHRHGQKGDGKV